MNEPKYTKGPWYSSEKTIDGKTVIWAHGEGVTGPNSINPSKHIAELYDSKNTPANALLIAAAPELLEAGKAALAQLDALKCGKNFKCYAPLKAAIAKAEGK